MLQNTDPLVFGDSFLYSNCRQGAIGRLRELRAGSVIVFGSVVSKSWVVDTVFVVGDESTLSLVHRRHLQTMTNLSARSS